MSVMVSGILNINKPLGLTSFRVVAMVRRLSGERRVGHAGTLDPMATGVLPVCLGQGTRVTEFLLEASKVYRAEIELGVVTDTYDAAGRVIQRVDPSGVSLEQLQSALASFCGLIQQTPPMYSAVKYHGASLYKLARSGITIARKSRPTMVYRLELLDWQTPLATVAVTCGRGTYIRSLAYDLGVALGCGAHLRSLVRLRYGPFTLEDAVSLTHLEDAFRYSYWQHLVYPIDSVLLQWTAIVVSDAAGRSISSGRSLAPEDIDFDGGKSYLEACTLAVSSPPIRCRAYTLDGHFLGVLRFNPARREWHPEKVFAWPND